MLSNRSFLKNVAIVSTGNLFAKLIGVLCTPVIARLYSTDAFGAFSIFVSLVSILGSFSTLRYSVTIPIAKDDNTVYTLLKLCFIITTILSIIIFLFLLVVNIFIETSTYYQIKKYLWLVPFIFWGQGIYEALNSWAIRLKEFKLITKTRIKQSISSSIIKIGFGIIFKNSFGLFLGHLIQEFTGIGNFLVKLLKQQPKLFKKTTLKELKIVAVRYKKFPLIQSWSQILLAVGAQLPVIMVGTFYGTHIVGLFGLAMTVLNAPMDLIGQSVAQVYYSEISDYGKKNISKIFNLSVTIIKKMSLIGLLPICLILIIGPWLFSFLLGHEWYDSGVFAQVLCLLIYFKFISSPIMNCLNVLERQDIQLFFNVVRTILTVIIFLLSFQLEFPIKQTLIFYSISMSIFYLLIMFNILRILKNATKK